MYTPRCELKDPRNINIINSQPEEALDMQSELIFVNGMVHLPQEWNFGIPTFTSYTTVTPPQRLPKRFSRVRDVTRLRIKALLRVFSALRARRSIKQVKACLAIHDW